MSEVKKETLTEEQLRERIEHRSEYSNKDKLKMAKVWWREQKPEDRVKNTDEVPFRLSELEAQAEAVRCMDCIKKNCVAGCPVAIDVPAMLRLVGEGDFRGAVRKMKETNVLPAITGRVCPQETQCQAVCLMSKAHKSTDEAVSIGKVEAFLADWERENGVEIPECAPATGKKVAVIGGGPAGLTCAADLARLGHGVTILEAFHKLGGVLVYGIPEFRLPKKIVEAEIGILGEMGVKFEPNVVVGQTVTIDELLDEEGYDAVFVATGAGLPWFMDLPGEDLNGVYSANEYLTRANLMNAYKYGTEADTPIADSKRLAVVGGGNVAMDAARTAIRLGVPEVLLVYRRTEAEMPARVEEIHHAKEEGVQLHLLTSPVEYTGNDKGFVTGMKLQRMELGEPDASGRRRPVPIEGAIEDFDVDTVVVSIGNGANPLIPRTTPGLDTNERKGTIVVDFERFMTSRPAVFAGGDIVVGASTVIMAMGHGRTAAASIHQYLQDGEWPSNGEAN